ncbi:hypothetical protein [Bacillus cereus]|uniref:hypothetical protein n=1 Tax=Bacillus cereus TaxID=1396 RepID=UPI0014447D39|nr:hypothetical protein [Bacillus cereus]NKW87074.1 hypothetical protein [Bacillus cereus]
MKDGTKMIHFRVIEEVATDFHYIHEAFRKIYGEKFTRADAISLIIMDAYEKQTKGKVLGKYK